MQSKLEKRCSKCGTVKPLDQFFARKSGSADGRMSSCKACKKAAIYKWREENKEKWAGYVRERARRPEDVAKRAAYNKRPEVRRRRLERERTPEMRETRKRWREENKDKLRHYYLDKNHKRRAATKSGVTQKQWSEIKAKYKYRCIYCGEKTKLTMDHEIPLIDGGKHEPSNIVPACLSCNASKGRMHPVEFAQERLGRLL